MLSGSHNINTMKNLPNLTACCISLLILISACKKDNPLYHPTPNVPVPKQYYLKSIAASEKDSIVFSYDQNMRLVQGIVYRPTIYAVYGKDSTIFTLHYNTAGRLDTLIESISVSKGSPMVTGYYPYEYNPDGTVSRISSLNNGIISEYREFQYNTQKQVTGITYYRDSAGIYKFENTTTLVYDSIGNLLQIGRMNQGIFSIGTEYQFDNMNAMYKGFPFASFDQNVPGVAYFGIDVIRYLHNLTSTVYHMPYGGKITATMKYIYNADRYPVQQSYSSIMGGGGNQTYRITYYVK
jgi:hypothetical protein